MRRGCAGCAGAGRLRRPRIRVRIWRDWPPPPELSHYRNLPIGYAPDGASYKQAGVTTFSIVTVCGVSEGIDVADPLWLCWRDDNGGATNCAPSARGGWECSVGAGCTGVGATSNCISSQIGSLGQTWYRDHAVYNQGAFTAARMEIELDLFAGGSGNDTSTNMQGAALFSQRPGAPGFFGCGVSKNSTTWDSMRIWEQSPAGASYQSLSGPTALPTTVFNQPDTLGFIATNLGGTMGLQGFWNGALVINTASANVVGSGQVGLAIFRNLSVFGGNMVYDRGIPGNFS